MSQTHAVPAVIRHPHRRPALAALLTAEAMNLLDATIVQVAAPEIHSDLGGGSADIQWFSAAYTLPFALLLITGGRLGDIAGRRRVFRIGMAAFVLASLSCAVEPSAGWLIATRAVQGAAAALVVPQTFGLIRRMFADDELPRALGGIGPVMGLAAVCGPVLGGVLTKADLFGSSWRAVFLVNVPVGIVVLAMAPLLLEDRAEHRPRLDPIGTMLAVLGIGLVVYPLIEGDAAGWAAWTWLCLAAGPMVLGLLAAHQRAAARRGRSALVETSLFRGRAFPAALATSTLFFAGSTGLTLVVVLQVELGGHGGPLAAAAVLLPWSAGSGLASLVAGALSARRFGPRLMPAGLVVVLIGLLATVFGYATARPTAWPWPVLPALAVVGAGSGLFTVPFFTTALGRVRPSETGSAAGLLNAVQQVGGTLGVAALGSVFLHADAAGGATAAMHGARDATSLALGLVVATLGAAVLVLPPGPLSAPYESASGLDDDPTGRQPSEAAARRLTS